MNHPYYLSPYYSNSYYSNVQMCSCGYQMDFVNQYWPYSSNAVEKAALPLIEHGKEPFVVNINQAAKQNNTFRTAIWTGNNLQVTLMRIEVGEDIGLEVHPDGDQFLRIEAGQGIVQMGDTKDHLYFQKRVYDDDAIIVPAGKWHNLTNTGNTPLKLYTIYAPPEHPFGTIHQTKTDAEAAED